MNTLKEKVILVTGAGHRLGFEITKMLLSQNARVIAHYNTCNDELQSWLAKNPNHVNQITFVQADLRNELYKIEKILNSEKSLWGVINSAAVFQEGMLNNVSLFEEQLEINTLVPLRLIEMCATYITDGVAINIIDGNIQRLNKRYQSYRVTKLFLEELTRQLAFTYKGTMRVNGVAPGSVIPPVGHEQQSFERAKALAPLQKMPSIDSVVDTVLFLLQNADITGEIIAVDGGMHIL